MKTVEAPFPFTSMFQNGPRRQGSAAQNLFKPEKIFLRRAQTARPCRLRAVPKTFLSEGKGGKCKAKTILRSWPTTSSLWSESWRRNRC
jgi:hypothetical protein